MSILVKHLTKCYGSQKATDDLSFEARKGEIVGFLGPNGAGKSTTMKIITGYLTPDQGTVEVCGYDVRQSPIATKKKIGYLPESNPCYPDMYVREYLHFIAELHRVPKLKERTEAVIRQVGLEPEAHKKIGQLSKGYKQRVGLAAALIHDPEVLILDEPTTGLDPNQIIEIREVIRQLGCDKTVLFSSHILQEVEALCDRVVIIHKGKRVADGPISSLISADKSTEVRLELKETVEPGLFRQFESVVREGENIWKFRTTQPDELRRALVQLALDHSLTIIQLQSAASQNLEAIFRKLTQDPPLHSSTAPTAAFTNKL